MIIEICDHEKLLLNLLLLVCIAGCKKEKSTITNPIVGNPKPVEKTIPVGSLSGTIIPAGAVTKVIIASTRTSSSVTINVNANSGAFGFAGLLEGDYSLSFITATGYNSIKPVNISIQQNKNADAGAITATETVFPTGSLSGTISPAGSVTRIQALPAMGSLSAKSYILNIDAATGKFNLTNMIAGDYNLYFTTDNRYLGIQPLTVKVVADKTTDLAPVITSLRPPVTYTISCNVNGEAKGWLMQSIYGSFGFTIGNFSVATSPRATGTYSYPGIILKDVTGPGTYICNSNTANKFTYATRQQSSGLMLSHQSTEQVGGGEATVIITEIDPVARTVKGTFTANLTSRGSSALGNAKTITNGVINAKY